jgi:phosphatidylethanolamine/phosphatidyl-N-methylethanolamine N-methyltransferase
MIMVKTKSKKTKKARVLEPLQELASVGIFVKELITKPRHIGTAVPSSRQLARHIANLIKVDKESFVVELGPGTGVITEALLARGIPPHKIILVERSRDMIEHFLEKKFPHVTIIHGDAGNLRSLFRRHFGDENIPISSIVSCLPLRSLPKESVERITHEVKIVLKPGGSLIQYTYDIRPHRPVAYKGLSRVSTDIVWLNFPPARVDQLGHED